MRRAVFALALSGAFVLGPIIPARAHPLGNFTVNLYSGLRVSPGSLFVDRIVDMAEIPTFQAKDAVDADGDGTVADGERVAYAADACRREAAGLRVTADGQARALRVDSADVVFPEGSGGLPTLRLTCGLIADVGASRRLTYSDGNHVGRIGWHEVVAIGDGVTLAATDVPTTSVSARLTLYPQDLLSSPLDIRTAQLETRQGGPRSGAETHATGVGGERRGLDRLSATFVGLVGRQKITVPFAMLAMLIAIGLGALHALAPGHGKTVMAAYLVGRNGTLRQAGVIGLTVTLAHTAGVLALGVIVATTNSLAPERVYPWLGLISGLMLLAIGAALAIRAVRLYRRGMRALEHEHGHDDHRHESDPATPSTTRGLIAMGLAGGLVPSPSALVVLLGAIAIHRVWFGVVLVVLYGFGMAATLTAAGLLLVRARASFSSSSSGPLARVSRLVPAIASGAVILAGSVLTVRAVTQV